jgi:putative hydrolase of the HAD superfamily
VCLFDMDGVIRQWSGAVIEQAEKSAGLAPGELIAIMTSVPEYDDGLVGRATFEDWCSAIERLAAERVGPAAAHDLVTGWRAFRGELDPAVVELVAQVRQRMPVGLLSNAHDQLPSDLALLGLTGAFDEVIGSAAVGLAKPDPRIYELAAAAFGVTPSECFFIDDLAPNIEAAKALGMDGVVFTSAAQLRADLTARGLLDSQPV